MFPTLNQTGDDSVTEIYRHPYRHRYRHPSKSSSGNGFGMTVTIGDDESYSYAGKSKQERFSCVYAKEQPLSSPIVTEVALSLEKQAFSVVTIPVTMRKRGFYRHPYRHRHDVCLAEAPS